MKKKNIPVEFVFQLFALIIAVILVHAFYVSVVRPNAAEIIEQQNIEAKAAAEVKTTHTDLFDDDDDDDDDALFMDCVEALEAGPTTTGKAWPQPRHAMPQSQGGGAPMVDEDSDLPQFDRSLGMEWIYPTNLTERQYQVGCLCVTLRSFYPCPRF